MSWTINFVVTDCSNGKPLKGVVVSDGSVTSTTDANGKCAFTEDDNIALISVNFSAPGYSALQGQPFSADEDGRPSPSAS
jgi:hypothetical protein